MPNPGLRRRGFSLIDSLAASVVLGITVTGVCGALAGAYQHCQIIKTNNIASVLARQLCDEISSKPLADPTDGSTALGPRPSLGETTRSTFNHVTNYHNYTDTTAAVPALAGGTIAADGNDVFARSVTITLGAAPSCDTQSPASEFAMISVTVTGADGESVTINQFVSKFTIYR